MSRVSEKVGKLKDISEKALVDLTVNTNKQKVAIGIASICVVGALAVITTKALGKRKN